MNNYFRIVGLASLFLLTTNIRGAGLDITSKTPSEYSELVLKRHITLPALCHLLHVLPDAEKARIRLAVKNERDKVANTSRLTPGTYDAYLIALDDQATIEKSLTLFRQSPSDAAFALSSAGNPNIIKLIGDDILGPNQPRGAKDVVVYGPASEAWSLVREIIAVAPEFSQNVKDWAKSVPEQFLTGDPEPNEVKIGNIVRAWWKENRSFFHTSQFDKVQPGERFEFSYGDSTPKKMNEKSNFEQSPVATSPQARSSRSGWEVFGAIGAALLLATGFLAFRGKKNN